MSTVANPYASPETADLVNERYVRPVEPKIFAFEGRLGRMRLVTYSFLSSFVFIVAAALGMAVLMPINMALGILVYAAAVLLSLVYGFSLYVRRLHDLGKSGGWSLLILVPLVNIGLIIYLLFFKGIEGANEFGAPTTPNSSGVKAGFIASLVFMLILPILAAIAIPAYQDYVQRAQQAQMQ